MQSHQETRAQPGTRGRPGTPSLLRVLNDRAALGLLLGGEMLTRSQISEYTGVSKVTVSQMLTRLEERGLVAIAGEQAGGRGPNAALYSVVPSSAYVAGLYVDFDLGSAALAHLTGRVVAEGSGNPDGAEASAWPPSWAAGCTGARPGPRARSATCRCTARRCTPTSGTRPVAVSSPWLAAARCANWRLSTDSRRRRRPRRFGPPCPAPRTPAPGQPAPRTPRRSSANSPTGARSGAPPSASCSTRAWWGWAARWGGPAAPPRRTRS